MKLKKMIDNIVDYENDVKDCENSCKQRIQIEEARDHDIDIAQKQKKKLDNDLLLMLKDIGSGLFYSIYDIFWDNIF